MNVQPAGSQMRATSPSSLEIQRAKLAPKIVPGQLKSAVIEALTNKGMNPIEAQNVLEKMTKAPNSPYSRVLNDAISKFKSSSNPGQHERMLNNSAKGLVDAWDPKSGSFIKNASQILSRTGGNASQRVSSMQKTFKHAPIPKPGAFGNIENIVKQGIILLKPAAEVTLEILKDASKTSNPKIKLAVLALLTPVSLLLAAEAAKSEEKQPTEKKELR